MQNGVCPFVNFDPSGEISLIATGVDSCTEHSCGLAPLQSMLCEAYDRVLLAGESCALSSLSGRSDLLEAYFQGEVSIEFPALLRRKQISKNLDRVRFEVQRHEGEPIATLWVCRDGGPDTSPLHGLQFSSVFALGKAAQRYSGLLFDAHKRLRVAGAWDSRGFAVSVRGEYLVDRLTRFYARLRAGRCAFGSSFFDRPANSLFSGVVLVDVDRLGPDSVKQIDRAQRQFISDCLLSMSDATNRVNAYKSKSPLSLSYVWNVWHPGDKLDSHGDWVSSFVAAKRVPRVACAVNPIVNNGLDYYGPYEAEDLIAYAQGQISSIKCVYDKAQGNALVAN